MDLIKLLDLANPKKVKDTINNLLIEYSSFTEQNTEATNRAIGAANQALVTADHANTVANVARINSKTAMSDAQAAVNTSIEAKETSDEAYAFATDAFANSEDAVEYSDQAFTNANEAMRIAEAADALSIQAQQESSAALSFATEANTKSDNAVLTANNALELIQAAYANSEAAVNTANNADANATTALNTANIALTNSSNAVNTANIAEDNSNTAMSDASTALANSNTALSNSENAVSTSDEAKRLAQEAVDTVVGGAGTQVTVDGVKQATWESNVKADKTDIPTALSQLTNDSGFITIDDVPKIPDNLATKNDVSTAITGLASEVYVNTQISNLIDSAPETLNTLNELAVAIQENDTLIDTLNSAIGTKANQTDLNTTNSNVSSLNTRVAEQDTTISNKVDKVDGKGLSTEDYTTEEKTKLAGLSNYDDTEIVTDIRELILRIGQDEGSIRDLWVNFNNLANVAKTGSYNDLIDKPTIESTENKMDKENPTGTGSFSLNRKADTTIGDCSVAEGYDTTASGNYSHSEGNYTTASGDVSHAEGFNTTASGDFSHAEGSQTTATSMGSHAEGWGTTASNVGSHSEGQGTTASSGGSHAEGLNTIASGMGSHAEGANTIASGENQHVFGKCNIEDTANTYIEIVGNGSLSSPANARTLDWSGNQWLAGSSTAQTFNAVSDRRLKENIKDYKCKKSILDLPIKEFDYKKTGTHAIGCIAQDLQEICPEIVNIDKDGYLSIQESKLVYLLLQEVKQLKAEIDKLKEV